MKEKDRINSEYSMGKWEFIVQEQSGAEWMENYKEQTSEGRGNVG